MARIRSPFLSLEAHGSVGALTVQSSPTGPIARLRWPGVRRLAPKSSDSRFFFFSKVLKYWRNTDSVTYSKWLEFSRNFPLRTKNGSFSYSNPYSWFLRLNCTLAAIGQDLIFLPPTDPNPKYFPEINVSYTVEGFLLTVNPAIPNGNFVVVRQKRNLSITQQKHTFLPISHVFDHSIGSQALITGPCGEVVPEDPLPPFICGNYCIFRIQIVDQYGRSSPYREFFLVGE